MKIFDLIKWFASPLVRLCTALFFPVGYVIAAILNPAGALNHFAIKVVDALGSVWPSTPNSLKLSTLLYGPTQSMSFGAYAFREFLSLVFLFLGVILVVKLYKLIPFKAT